MRSAKQRTAKYNAKTDPVTVRRKVAAQLPTMMAAYAAYVDEIVPVEEAVRTVLGQEKVVGIGVLYLDFARQLWKCKKKYTRAALVIGAQSIKERWRARGLDDRVLKRIASAVFGISLA